MPNKIRKFPTPLEVDRGLYKPNPEMKNHQHKFPAPTEEDRELYGSFDADFYIEVERFPAPLEVRRFLYFSAPRY